MGDKTIYLKPLSNVSVFCDAILEHTGTDVSKMNEEQLRSVCKQLHIQVGNTMGKGKLIDALW